MMLVRTYITRSQIEGVGIYAADPIAKGSQIWKYDPLFDHLVTRDAVSLYPGPVREFITRYAYPHHELPNVLVLEMDNGRFMNHSDEPNTDFTAQVTAVALTDISAGEEITCNYAEFESSYELLPSIAAHALPVGINGSENRDSYP